jgi:hypothetical protein
LRKSIHCCGYSSEKLSFHKHSYYAKRVRIRGGGFCLRTAAHRYDIKLMNRQKVARIFILLAICAVAGIVLFSLYRQQALDLVKARKDHLYSRIQSSDKSVIRGLRYSANVGEGVTLTIQADEFRVGKKKIGFLRFSLLNEVELKNAKIQILRTSAPRQQRATTSENPAPNSEAPPVTPPQLSVDKMKTEGRYLVESAKTVLKEIAASNPFPGIPTKRVASVKIAPIDLRVSDETSTLASISAGSAALDMKSRKIIFSGNVTATEGKEVWQGDELTVDPVSGTVTRKKGSQPGFGSGMLR